MTCREIIREKKYSLQIRRQTQQTWHFRGLYTVCLYFLVISHISYMLSVYSRLNPIEDVFNFGLKESPKPNGSLQVKSLKILCFM